MAVLLLTACHQRTVYHHYEHTPVAGWEKNDTMTFLIGPMEADGYYSEEVGLRINGAYPFMGLQLVVQQTVLPSRTVRLDTLVCSLINEQGNPLGSGISHYQYLFPLTTLHLSKGDQLHVAVRHDMKREILPGVADIGVRLSAQLPSENH